MAFDGFVDRHAANPIAQYARALGEERRPHLLDAIGKTNLEDAARGGLERRLEAEIDLPPEEFERLRELGLAMGYRHVESGPLVRSSYHAEEQVRLR